MNAKPDDPPAQRLASACGAVRLRYLLGSSRGVGVRLVREPGTPAYTALDAWEIASRLNRCTACWSPR